jgi:hypothetical protein
MTIDIVLAHISQVLTTMRDLDYFGAARFVDDCLAPLGWITVPLLRAMELPVIGLLVVPLYGPLMFLCAFGGFALILVVLLVSHVFAALALAALSIAAKALAISIVLARAIGGA